ncbi:MAG: acetyl-CoA synthetase [Thermoplasmata archaeon]|nr:MAG: acetyl-CoA synthetase [Thermoplasmata archaeon]
MGGYYMKILTEYEAKKILKKYGIPVPREELAKNEKEAKEIAKKIGFPVVLKLISPDILHRTDIGGVILDIKDEKGVIKSYRSIIENAKNNFPNARIRGVLVQEMLPHGKEVIVGLVRDKQFGHVIMFGLGGIFVEILKDVSFRVIPIDKKEAMKMIQEIKGYKILEGVRGSPPSDLDALADILVKVSKLGQEFPNIIELDINPLFSYEKGAIAVDCRIIMD